jgi:citrate lyase beta subunit
VATAARHPGHPLPLRLSAGEASFTLTLWTDDPVLAAEADAAGVDRIGLDLDVLGKAVRQRGRATWISPHRLEAVEQVGAALRRAALFARTNPLHDGTAAEVEHLLAGGARVLMLPMFRTPEELKRFLALVGGRAAVVPLVETADAAARVDELLAIDGVDELHVGLNDLSLELGLRNRFALLVSPLLEHVAECAAAAGVPWGCGGIGRAGDEGLPIPAELVYARLAALGASGALLARSFASAAGLAFDVRRARARLASWRTASVLEHAAARRELELRLDRIGTW